MDRAIREHGVGAARVKAIDFPIVAAVKGARAQVVSAVGAGSPDKDGITVAYPGAAPDLLVQARPAYEALSRPAGILDKQIRLLGLTVFVLARKRSSHSVLPCSNKPRP
jgi:hypothetical protein